MIKLMILTILKVSSFRLIKKENKKVFLMNSNKYI